MFSGIHQGSYLRSGVFFVGKVLNYKFNFKKIWLFSLCLLERASGVCVFEGICPFHLSYRVYWHNVVPNIS